MRAFKLASLVLMALLATAFGYAQGVITTVAGSGRVLRGAGGPATSASMGNILGLATDSSGNLFASDTDNNQVVVISPNGILTVVAGNGITGYSGDGGLGTRASLWQPSGLAVDATGNLYIADSFNNRIREVTHSDTITTFAGGNCCALGDGGPALSAWLPSPSGLVFDSVGNLYVSTVGDNRIRKISPSGTITTVAGNGTAGFSGDGGLATSAQLNEPRGLALDAAGNLYFADRSNNRIRRIGTNGGITTVAGNGVEGASGDGGPATSATLNTPWDVTLDAAGNLYIADLNNNRIRKVTPAGIITTVVGNGCFCFGGDGGPAVNAYIATAQGVLFDANGNLLIADGGNDRIRKVTPGGIISTIAGTGTQNFSGDGGQATVATLSRPSRVAVDGAGNLYIADSQNQRIRKVSPGGIISTVAGNGVVGFSGDGGPATSASLNLPYDVAVDAAGDIYFSDSSNGRARMVNPAGTITTVAGGGSANPAGGGLATNATVCPYGLAMDGLGNLYFTDNCSSVVRKVSPSGILSTVAGNGSPGYSGDGGPAVNASIGGPGGIAGVAVDSAGNIYIADTSNNRVRKVSTAGIITTVAGNGVPNQQTGSGGPATAAAVGNPLSVAVDSAGNLYIDSPGTVRKVTPAGIISTFAGNFCCSLGDGNLSTSAFLNVSEGVSVDAAGNVYIADTHNDRVREVLATPPSFSASPASVQFSATAGQQVISAQQVQLSGSVTGVRWTATASTQSGGNWLTVSPPSGTVPAILKLAVSVAKLVPGTYQGSVTIQAPLASPSTVTVAVSLTVSQGAAASLSVAPASLSFSSHSSSSNPPTQTLQILNGGPGQINWTAKATTSSGGGWLTISPASGTAAASSPAAPVVSVSVAGLQNGVYTGSIQVSSSTTNQAQTVAVTLLLSQQTQTVLLSRSGLLFTGVAGAGAVPSQGFGILNTGQGTMNWTVQPSTLAGGNWMSVSPSSGSSTANSLTIPLVDTGANATGLAAGLYTGLVRVNAPGAENSPQFASVHLNVLPQGSNPGVLVRPTGLIFAAQAGTSSPASQSVKLTTAAPGNVQVRANAFTFDGADWLQILPGNVTLSPSAPATITVQPALGSLAPGVYQGAITLLFSDVTPAQVVDVLFLVTGGLAGAARGGSANPEIADFKAEFKEAAGCTPQQLFATFQTLGAGSASPVGWPSPIDVQVVDDCGDPVFNASVVASFTNGDPPLTMASLGNGVYAGTWKPVNSSGQVTVTVRADSPPLTSVQIQSQGQVSDNPTAPALNSGGVVNAASFASGKPLAPGSIVSVFGRNLASAKAGSTVVPLPTTLGGATLSVGGVNAPLFYSSDGQVNAQIPFEMATNNRPQVIVLTSQSASQPQTVTVPETITIAPTQPAIFTTNQQGTGQGAILNARGVLVDSGAPANPGDVVQIFGTGFGLTQPAVPSGQPAPSAAPLALVAAPVTAQIGGLPATVQFAGLAPGFIGLYQVNVQVPAGVTPGPAVPLVLLQNGVPSNTATLAVQ